jgi:5-formyltetrahydrofolate cyclo-ligase
VLKCLFSLPEYQSSRSLSVYLSMPSGEISTTEIVNHAFQQGKKIFIPYTYKLSKPREFWPTSVMDMVQLKSLDDYQTLKPDKWGIPSPSRESIGERRNCFGGLGRSDGEATEDPTESELGIIIMPGLAFDRHLERTGHGKGYYDFFLQRYLWHTQKAHIKMPFLGKNAFPLSFLHNTSDPSQWHWPSMNKSCLLKKPFRVTRQIISWMP